MRFRFIGRYTNGHTSICMMGVTFEGNEPAQVDDPAAVARLSNNIEFEVVKSARGRKPRHADL